ncbi:hypothetical protein ABVB70_23000, partial [Agrobacterium radiobacter]
LFPASKPKSGRNSTYPRCSNFPSQLSLYYGLGCRALSKSLIELNKTSRVIEESHANECS